MTTQILDGEAAVLMIMEGVEDADDQKLASMLSSMLNKPVKVTADDEFEVDWVDTA
jgi:hypothetical protein